MNSWDVKLEATVPFSKIIHKRTLSEMFENKNTFYTIIS
jgi:hypothetical protein